MNSSLIELMRHLAAGDWHSGADLADELGVSRTTINNRIADLERWGVEVESRHGKGYRLREPCELLDPAAIRAALPVALAQVCPVTVLPTTDSTNNDAMHSPERHCAVLAEHQSAGRGRRGRAWVSPFARNLYLSLGWTWDEWPTALASLGIATGVQLAATLNDRGVPARVKWPNDLWLDGRKLGGVLIEQRGEVGGPCRVSLGVGINVAMRDGAIDQDWTSLQLAGHALSRQALAAACITDLAAMLEAYPRDSGGPLLQRHAEFDGLRDRRVRLLGGAAPAHGIARGIDTQGRLLVEAEDGTVAAHIVGDVSLRLGDD